MPAKRPMREHTADGVTVAGRRVDWRQLGARAVDRSSYLPRGGRRICTCAWGGQVEWRLLLHVPGRPRRARTAPQQPKSFMAAHVRTRDARRTGGRWAAAGLGFPSLLDREARPGGEGTEGIRPSVHPSPRSGRQGRACGQPHVWPHARRRGPCCDGSVRHHRSSIHPWGGRF
jgi:hypothetical protein